jgi:hypothetical protein
MSQMENAIICKFCEYTEVLGDKDPATWMCRNGCTERKPGVISIRKLVKCTAHNPAFVYDEVKDPVCPACLESETNKIAISMTKLNAIKPNIGEMPLKQENAIIDAFQAKRQQAINHLKELDNATIETPKLLKEVLNVLSQINSKLEDRKWVERNL